MKFCCLLAGDFSTVNVLDVTCLTGIRSVDPFQWLRTEVHQLHALRCGGKPSEQWSCVRLHCWNQNITNRSTFAEVAYKDNCCVRSLTNAAKVLEGNKEKDNLANAAMSSPSPAAPCLAGRKDWSLLTLRLLQNLDPHWTKKGEPVVIQEAW